MDMIICDMEIWDGILHYNRLMALSEGYALKRHLWSESTIMIGNHRVLNCDLDPRYRNVARSETCICIFQATNDHPII